ncbi:MAG TPA: sigma-54 dependent transcriptional regulator [Polyangiaceae bacterium]|nr:sigma-54 dependent transcriptional regulator [Polyangiaceae bacterium]
MNTTRVMVIEDDEDLRFLLERMLRARGHAVASFPGAQQALRTLESQDFDTIVTDWRMPGMDGLELCAKVKESHPHIGMVLVSAYGDLTCAVEAMRLGVSDFITKPVQVDELENAIARSNRRAEAQIRKLELEQTDEAFHRIIGTSSAITGVIRQLRRIAPSDCTVLVTGESGTGKELIARTLHEHGKRRDRPFVAVNCAAIPSELLESEFFGHKRGAFTGAAQANEGLFLAANGGTIFFDEVSAMPMQLQAKLLRALQERTVRAVGSRCESPIDVRIIAAANQDLDEAVEHRAFRRDLLFRLDVVRIDLPPLREREADSIELAQHFLMQYAERLGKQLLGFSEEAAQRLRSYCWPGNVRELENCVQASLALARGPWITLDDLPVKVRKARRLTPVVVEHNPELPLLEEIERRHIERVLRAVRGNKAAAARILGINRVTLYRKLAQSHPSSD